ncbi:MAG: oligopeptide transporter, OPT family [Lachnospiraceae bacterium]|nr:oligopeptide transporter, OPT family [Lachnospiraceae bacterium]
MNEEFKPYIPASKSMPEITPTAVILGMLLALIFGAANAYLGLKVGLTISASIPAAVISMAVIRVILKKDSILENNMVQTIGSAGESLAAGVIFTVPALFLWAQEGIMDMPSLLAITIIALFGGLLGIFFMVPLRNALIVKEHGILPYPEGTACAEVLLAGESGGSAARAVFEGIGISAVVKLVVDGFHAVPGIVTLKFESLKTELSTEVYPSLIAVGYICGAKISAYMFAGGLLGWFVLIPAIAFFGADAVIYPGTEKIAAIYASDGASGIWSSYIRYIGAGAVAAAGIISLIKTLPLIGSTFAKAVRNLKSAKSSAIERTTVDLDMRIVIGGIVVVTLGIWLVPIVPVTLLGALLIVIFGFFFCTVSSRMVGLVGSSNNPVSGMTIATLLIAAILLKLSGDTGAHGMQGAISIGTIICIAAAMAGDTSQDLKTGYILGATPVKQQLGEILGTIVAAFAIGAVLILLNSAYGFGTDALSAPQAAMMKMIIEGVMDGNLPWTLIFIGAFLSISIEILGVPALPVAIGLYLPLELSSGIMVGGLIRFAADKKNKNAQNEAGKGVLFCSGLIAGEGLLGVIIAILTVVGIVDKMDVSASFSTGWAGALILLIVLAIAVYKSAVEKKA